MSNFYYNDDHTAIAVLVSYGYGAGWSSWAYSHPEIAWDRRVVEAFLKWEKYRKATENPDDLYLYAYIGEALDEMSLGEKHGEYIYMGGVDGLELEWVPIGSLFQIHEYDGAESLVIFDEANWTRAE